MKKGFGMFLVALVSAAAGAAAAIFAMKKRDEGNKYEYDYDDDKFFEDCDGDCEGCDGCDEMNGDEDIEEVPGETSDEPSEAVDFEEDEGLDSYEEPIEDPDTYPNGGEENKSDF
ncbi:MAG: hypothetical protein JG769_1737 [Oscillospiraceae bacterium]|jgi:hypothetical protein|nr:hypothetical protein [Oscillospiraceae bacterium]